MVKWLFAMLLFLALGLTWHISATSFVEAQQEPLVVEGQVVNGTANIGEVSGLTITFHEEGFALHEHMETVTDSQGRFRFEGINFDPTIVYGVSLRYGDALYGTDLDLSNGSPSPITLNIYESTSDQEVLNTTLTSVLFADADKATETIAALEIIQFTNESDHTYVPGSNNPMNLLRFGLPPGATGLEVDTRLLGADVVQVDRGFAILANVPPGTHEVMYTYSFPYEGTEATFSKSFPFGSENLRVLSPNEVLNLSSEDIGDPGPVNIGERSYQLIEATDMTRGSRINVRLSGLPRKTFGDRLTQGVQSIRYEYVVPVVLGIMMAVLAVYALRRRRNDEMVSVTESPSIEAQERQTIHQLIADLERNFGRGSMSEDDYIRRRRVLESRLASLSEK